jgi:lysozyme
MQISESGLTQLRGLELRRLTAYWDNTGWALGYGQHDPSFNQHSTCTPEQAEQWLLNTTGQIAESVSKLVRVPVSQGQFDVLVIFCYNVGLYAFAASSLLSGLNSGNYSRVSIELLRWIYSDHKISSALVARRQAEARLWNYASTPQKQNQETFSKG